MNETKTVNILFCGTGGQGVLSASEVCGWAAIYQGFHVKKSEVHGMAQRGGSVESHLRFGKNVFSPLIPFGKADFLVSFHAEEHARMKEYLSTTGVDLIKALDAANSSVDDRRFTNIFILGCLSKHLVISQENWLLAIEKLFATKSLQKNKEIFSKGREAAL